jgi:xylan 1,4-beta-xylosidase
MKNTYANPIIPGFHPDPSICRVGDDYFLVNSSFACYPGVPAYHSRDLVHWRQIGHCLTRPEQLPLGRTNPSGGIFAPTIRYHDGVFYMVTTNVTGGGNFYVTTRDPSGAWSDPIWVAQSGIDPSLLFQDGHVYFTSTGTPDEPDPAVHGQGIIQSEIDPATGQKLTKSRLIWTGTGGAYPEGPHLYKIGKYYYLMIAEGGTEYGHTEVIARSDSPWGPWESCPRNPILTHRSYNSPIQALGHADLVEAQDGSWWLVCLGFRPNVPQVHHLGRETFLAPVEWDQDGWPQVGKAGRIALEMEAPRLSPVTWPAPPERDDFDSQTLGLKWNFLGIPRPEDWSLTARASHLRLLGQAAGLDDGSGVVLVGCRQEHFNCEVSVSLEFAPAKEGEEAGLTAWMDARHHYDIYVTREGDSRIVAACQRIGSLSSVVARKELAEGPVTLLIRANRMFYTFAVITGSGEEHALATGETRYLSSEVAGGFTGVYFAMYASGNGQACAVPADFDWFDYRDLEQEGCLSIDSKISELLNDERAKAVVARHLPELAAHPPADWGANLSLLSLAAMSPEAISVRTVAAIDADLRAAAHNINLVSNRET